MVYNGDTLCETEPTEYPCVLVDETQVDYENYELNVKFNFVYPSDFVD